MLNSAVHSFQGKPMADRDYLSDIQKPSRYLGGELGSVQKPANQVDLTFALAFPDVYEVGMSHVGSSILYHQLNLQERIAAERVYAPWSDFEQLLRDRQEPLCSLESTRALADFDIVGFTLQYELSYTNLLNMLDLGGIPRRAAERDETAPLIVAGGPCAFNPEPLADFIDCAVIGDGEEAVLDLCHAVLASRVAGETRQELLNRLARIEGVYVPSLYRVEYRDDGSIDTIAPKAGAPSRVKRRFVTDLERAPFPGNPIVPFMNTVHNRVSVEIARGCTRGCRFCQAGYIYRPVRERSPQRVADIINESLRRSGFDETSLLSLSTGDYSAIEPLLTGLMECHADSKVAVSLPSLRVGSLTPELMEQIRKVRKTGFTLAPEAGSERLRDVINKGIKAEELVAAARTAFELGWRVIKLYFMLGLPTETDEDLAGIVDLAAAVRKSGQGTKGGADVNVSVSTFVPKPHTPFQWERQLGIDETRERQQWLQQELKRNKLRFKYHDAEMSMLEGVFARGDRRLGPLLEAAVDAGCQFDGWSEKFEFARWQDAFATCGIDPEWYLRERREDEILPWSHIDPGVAPSFFLEERARSRSGGYTADCRNGDCHACGLCDFEALRVRLAERAEFDPGEAPAWAPPTDSEGRFKVRLRLCKEGRARFVAHLEFMAVLHRAVRRAGLPLRYSGGFHPTPKLSFPDALPTGVASDAEIIDLELYEQRSAQQVVEALNAELPEGFRVLEAANVDWHCASPSASIVETVYRLELPAGVPGDLGARCDRFLAADEVIGEKFKKGRRIEIDLRRDLTDLQMREGGLYLTLKKGSPLPLIRYLLELDPDAVRRLVIRKVGVRMT